MAQCNIQGLVNQGISLQVIIDYADDSSNPATAPTLNDYQNLGIVGVTGDNLSDVNEAIEDVVGVNVDTIAEIQAIVNGVSAEIAALAKIALYADDSTLNVAPELSDYNSVGITGVTTINLPLINMFVDNATKLQADTKEEVQTLANAGIALEKVMNYADDSSSDAPILSDYNAIVGITGVTADNLAQINVAVENVGKIDVDTVVELQAIIDSVVDAINAINTIEEYANSNGTSTEPEVDTYDKANINGVDSTNLEAINARIASLDAADVDTQGEIQTVVDAVNALIKIENYADDDTNPKPTVDDYSTAGVTGVTNDNIEAVSVAIDALIGDDVNTVEEVQAIVNGINASIVALGIIEDYAQNDGTTTTPTQNTYNALGVNIPSNVSVAEVNLALIPLNGVDVDTKEEVQALIDSISALNKIEAYADDSNNDTPTVDDYLKAGAVGVTGDNINAANAAVAAETGDEVDTLSELQDVLNAAIDSINAISIISEYAKTNGTSTPPLLTHYNNASVTIPANTTVAEVNAKIATVEKADVDTKEEIQDIVDVISAHNTIKEYAEESDTQPTKADYEKIGVTGVTDDNLAKVNAAVKAVGSVDVDEVAEVQALVNGVNGQIAIEKIAKYAETNGTSAVPTADDYEVAGVIIPANTTVAEVNAKIATVEKADVDTKEEIQDIVDVISAHNTIKEYAEESDTQPTKADYEKIGVTGVTDDNLAKVNAAVKAVGSVDVDTISEVQELVDGVNGQIAIEKIAKYAETNGTSAVPTADDYEVAGVIIPANTTVAEVNAKIAGLQKADVDTKIEIQDAVDEISSYNTIKSYADDSTSTLPSVKDYENVGVIGVTADNIGFANAAVEAVESDDVDTLTELQAVISAVVTSVDAMETIVKYAESNGSSEVPTSLTYANVGATIPDNVTVAEVNSKIASLNGEDIDTLSELQDEIDTLSAFNTIIDYANDNSNDAPALDDYEQVGVVGVTNDNVEYVNRLVDLKVGIDVDTLPELQALIDKAIETATALKKIMDYADSNGTSTMPSVDTYAKVGSALPVNVPLTEANAMIASLSKEDVDSLDEIENILAAISALNKIEAYADDNSNPLPTVTDYGTAGIVGVTNTNISNANGLVDGVEGINVDTVAELQALLNNGLAEIAALDKIATFADTNGESIAPVASTYSDAGITVPANVTLAEINDEIKDLSREDVDTVSEVQSIVDIISTLNKIEAYADDSSSDEPILSDFATIGVTGVNSSNLEDVVAAIDSVVAKDVDTVEEVQALVNGVLRADSLEVISNYAHNDGTTTTPQQSDFDNIGVDLKGVTVNELNAEIAKLERVDVDTAPEVQALINAIAAINKIEAYADDSNNPKPTLEDYEDAGVIGVTAETLDDVNNAIDTKIGTEVDTLSEIQDIIDNIVAPVKAVHKIATYAGTNGTSEAPDADDYTDAGVNLGSATATEVNELVKTLEETDVDTAAEIQDVVDRVIALNKIEAYANNGNPIPTLEDYEDAGIVGVNVDNLDAVNVAVEAVTAPDVDTTSELQAVIDAALPKIEALHKIVKYADTDGSSTAPVVTDFETLEITIPSNVTLTEIKEALKKLEKVDVDTVVEIQDIVDSISALNKIEAYADDSENNSEPTLNDYLKAGAIGVTATNLTAANKAVDAIDGEDVDTLPELQAVLDAAIESIDALHQIVEYADTNGTSEIPTLKTYANAGVNIPLGTDVDEINNIIKTLNDIDVDTVAEIQAIVDAVVALNKIEAYAEDESNPDPTVDDYIDAGVIGVSAENIVAVNNAIKDVEGQDADTLAEVQAIIDAAVSSVKAINQIATYADTNGTSTKPTLTTFTNAGVTDVTSTNEADVNAMIASLSKEDVDTKDEIQAVVDHVIALDKIQEYAENNAGAAPTLDDFEDIDVTGVTTDNLATVHSYLVDNNIQENDVASSTEVQALIDAINKVNNLAKDGSETPLSSDYTTLELLEANSSTLSNETLLLNDVIEDKSVSDIDSSTKAHSIADIVEKVLDYASSDGATDAPTLAELAVLGLNPPVTAGNIVGTLLQLKDADADGSDTVAELSAMVTTVNDAIADIRIAAEDNDATPTTPSLQTYTTAGITGVTADNLDSINDALNSDGVDASAIPTAIEIQEMVDAFNEIINGSDGLDNDNVTLDAEQYESIGVEGISDGVEVDLLNDILDNISDDTKLDEVSEIQAYLDIVEKLQEIANGNDTTPFDVTQAELESIGLRNLTSARTEDFLTTIATDESVPSSLSALQAKVDVTAADKAVEDDDTDTTPDSPGEFVIVDTINNVKVTEGGKSSDLMPTVKYKLTDDAKVGDVLKVYVDGDVAGSYTVTQADLDSDDQVISVSVDSAHTLSDRSSYTIQMTITDPALNESEKSDAITINTQVVQTTVTTVTFSDDENIDGDLITNEASQTITATLSKALLSSQTVFMKLDNGSWVDVTSSVANTTITLPNQTLQDGTHTYHFRIVQGISVGDETNFDYTLDTGVPSTTLSNVEISDDTGESDSDFVTNVQNQNITVSLSSMPVGDEKLYGTIDNGATWVEITNIDNSDLSNITATWNVNLIPSSDSDVSSKAIQFKVMDTAGNGSYSSIEEYVYDNDNSITSVKPVLETPSSGTDPVQVGGFTIVSDSDTSNIHALSDGDTTNDGTPIFKVKLPDGIGEGDFINIYDGSTLLRQYEIQSDDGNPVSVSLTSVLTTGDYELILEIETLSGYKSQKSDAVSIETDTTAPTQTISALEFSDDNGADDEDGITNEASQTISAELSAALSSGDKLMVRLDGGTWQDISSSIQANGTTISWPTTLQNGQHKIEMRVFDENGNGGVITTKNYNFFTADIDTVVTINSISDDTGISNSDFITKSPTQMLNATLDTPLGTGEELYYQLNDGAWIEVTNQRVVGTDVNINFTLTEGVNNIKLKVMDAAGNQNTVADKSITLNTVAPTTTVDDDGISISSDTGSSSSDFLVNNGTQTVSANLTASLESNEKLFARVDGGTWVDITSSVTGTSVSWSTSLEDGVNDIEIVVGTVSGVFGSVSSQEYTLDTTASDHEISNISINSSDDTGYLNSDFITTVQHQDITATLNKVLTANDKLYGSVDGGDTWVDITTVAVSGTSIDWQNVQLELGKNKIVFEVRDLAGNVADRLEQAYDVDQVAPTQDFEDGSLSLSNDIGDSTSDFITKELVQDITVELDGLLGTDRLYGRLDGGEWIDITNKVSTNADGKSELDWDNVTLETGSGKIELKIIDAAGNEGNSISKDYTVDTNALTTFVQESSVSLSSYGADDVTKNDFNTNQASQTITATLNTELADDESLRARVDGGAWVDITADVTGKAILWTTTLVSGDNDIEFQVVDTAGNQGPITDVAYTLDTTAPTQTFDDASLSISDDTGISDSDYIVNEAEQTIKVKLDSALGRDDIILASVDGGTATDVTDMVSLVDGEYVLSWDATLNTGTNTFEIQILDKAGNLGDKITKEYTLDTVAPLVTIDNVSLSNDDDSDFVVKDANQTIGARLSAALASDEKLYARVDGGTWIDVTSSVTGTSVSWNTSLTSGENDIEFKVTDTAGNDGTVSSSTYTLLPSSITTTISAIEISDDNGASDSDFITNVQSQTVTGTLSAALASYDTLMARVDGGAWIDISDSVTGTAISWDTSLQSGSGRKIEFRVENEGGAVGSVAEQSYTLDTTAPTITISSIGLSSDTGLSSSDGITNTASQTITARLSAGIADSDRVLARVDGGEWIDITSSVDGTNISWATTLASGSNDIEIVVQDLAGNNGEIKSQSYTLDVTAPTVEISSVSISSDTGTSNSDFITKTKTQDITLTLNSALSSDDKLYASVDGGVTWTDITSSISSSNNTQVQWNGVDLKEGNNTLAFKVQDTAGNDGALKTVNYQLDLTRPQQTISDLAISDDLGASDTDFITSVAQQTVTASLSSSLVGDEKLYGSIDGGDTWIDITSNIDTSTDAISWTVSLENGTSSIMMKVMDTAGNENDASKQISQQYTIDTSAPTQTISNLSISTDSDSLQGSDSDNITNVKAQSVTATLSSALQDGERLLARVENGDGVEWVDITSSVSESDGVYSVNWATNLKEGTHTIEMKVETLAGVSTPSFPTLSYTLDTTAPTQTISDLDISDDGGVSDSDFFTAQAQQTITATISASLGSGEKLYGSTNGGSTWVDITDKLSGTAISWDGAVLQDGTNHIVMMVEDVAGNKNTLLSQEYTLLTQSITTKVLIDQNNDIVFSSDNGYDSQDLITNEATQTISATLSATLTSSERLLARLDGGEWVDITSSVDGTDIEWSTTLVDGDNRVEFKVQDLAGNEGPTIGDDYRLDTTAITTTPTADDNPNDLTPESDGEFVLLSNEGTLQSIGDGDPTNDTTPILRVNIPSDMQADDVVAIYLDGTDEPTELYQLTSADITSGTVDIELPELENGNHSMKFSFVDLAGNESTLSSEFSFSVDTTIPTTKIKGIDISSDTGYSDSDFITKTGTQTVTATLSDALEDGEKVLARVDGGAWVDITSNVTGTAISWNTSLQNGTNKIEMKVQSAAGVDGPLREQEYTVDSTAIATTPSSDNDTDTTPDTQGEFVILDEVGGVTRVLDGGNSDDATPTVSIKLDEDMVVGDSVLIYDNGVLIQTYRLSADDLNGDGTVKVELDNPLSLGNHPLSVAFEDIAGNQTPASSPITINVTAVAPTQTISAIDISADSGSSDSDFITSVASQTITATLSAALEAGQTLIARVDGGAWVDITSSVSGTSISWQNVNLESGTNNIEMRVQASGQNGALTKVEYTLDTSAPTVTIDEILMGDDYINRDEQANVTVSGASSNTESGTTVTVTISDGTNPAVTTTATIDSDGEWQATGLDLSGLDDGSITISVTVDDLAGNTSAVTNKSLTLDTQNDLIAFIQFTDTAGPQGTTTDRITKDNFFFFKDFAGLGTDLEASSTFRFSTDGGSTWTVGSKQPRDGYIGFEVPDGVYNTGDIKVETTDVAGNVGTFTMTMNPTAITVDTTADTASVALASDTGISSSDQITQNGQINVTDVETTTSWSYRTKVGGEWGAWSNDFTNATTSFTLGNGTYNDVEIKTIDIAGNESVESLGEVIVDSVAASTPSVVRITDDSGATEVYNKQSGLGNDGFGDIITDDKSLELRVSTTGSMEGDTLLIYIQKAGGTTETQSYTLTQDDASNDFADITLDTTKFPSDGNYTISMKLRDLAGNETATSTPITLTLDTIVDDFSGVSIDTDTYGSHVVGGDSDQITSNGRINVSGLEVGTEWFWRQDTTSPWQKVTTSTDSSGNSYVILPEKVGSAAYENLQVMSIDKAGNESEITTIGRFVVDQTADDFTISLEDDTYGSHISGGATDKISSDGVVNVDGVTDENSVWYYKVESNDPFPDITVGTWVLGSGTSFNLPEGTFTSVKVKSVDVAGNEEEHDLGNVVVDKTSEVVSISLDDDTLGEHIMGGEYDKITSSDTVVVANDRGFDFDGTNIIYAGNEHNKFTTALTISVDVAYSNNGGMIFNKENSYEMVVTSDGSIHYALRTASATTWKWIDTGYDLTEGEYTNLTFTYSGADNQVVLYADGTSVYDSDVDGSVPLPSYSQSTNEPIPSTLNTTNNDLMFGQRGTFGSPFTGKMDNIKIYSDTLSSSEVTAMLDGDRIPHATQTEYNFNSQNPLEDNSGNGHNAKVRVDDEILLGTQTQKGDILDWGTVNLDGTLNVMIENVVGTIKAYDSDGNLAKVAYNDDPNNYGIGVSASGNGNDTSNEVDLGEKIVMEFGSKISNATIGFSSMGGNFDPSSAQNARIKWVAYDEDGNIVAQGELKNGNDTDTDLDGNPETQILSVSATFSKIEFSTVASSNSNFAIRYIEADAQTVVSSDNVISTIDGMVSVEGLGVMDENTAWYYRHDGMSDWTRGTGSQFSLGVASGETQTFTHVEVKTVDIAGNEYTSSLGTVVVDKEVDNFTVDVHIDTYGMHITTNGDTDQITMNGQIDVTGVSDAGSRWYYSVDGGTNWTRGFKDAFVLAEGVYTDVQVKSIDIAGNESVVDIGSVKVDQTGEDFTLSLDADTFGSFTTSDGVTHTTGTNSDQITNDKEMLVSNITDSDAVWFYKYDGIEWTRGSGASFNLDPNNTYTNVQVKTVDTAGNEIAHSLGTVVVDTQADTFNIDFLDTKGGTGTNSDKITKDTTIAIQGVESTSMWFYKYDGINWKYGGKGNGEVEFTTDGTYNNISFKTIDIAGNESAVTNIGNWTIDTQADDLVTDIHDDTKGEHTGQDADRITSNGQIDVTGVTDAGSIWQYSTDGGTNWITGSGTSFTLGEGVYANVKVRSIDVAGNVSAVFTYGEIVVDETVDDFTTALVDTAGGYGTTTDNITNDTQLRVNGVEDSSAVYYRANDGDGWTYVGRGVDTITLSDGVYTALSVRVVDIAGNEKVKLVGSRTVDTVSDDFTMRVTDTDNSATPSSDTGTRALTRASINTSLLTKAAGGSENSYTDGITNDGRVTVENMEGLSKVYVRSNGEAWTEIQKSSTQTTASFELGEGTHNNVQVRTIDEAGNINQRDLGNVIVDKTADQATLRMNDTGSSNTDRITKDGVLTVSGLDNDTKWYFRGSNGGEWHYGGKGNGIYQLGEGHYSDIQVQTIDRAGNSDTRYFGSMTVDVTKDYFNLKMVNDTYGGKGTAHDFTSRDGRMKITDVENGSKVYMSKDGGSWTELTYKYDSTTYGFTASNGYHEYKIKVVDKAGNEKTSVKGVNIDTTGDGFHHNIWNGGFTDHIGVYTLETSTKWYYNLHDGHGWRYGGDGERSTVYNMPKGHHNNVSLKSIDIAGNEVQKNFSNIKFGKPFSVQDVSHEWEEGILAAKGYAKPWSTVKMTCPSDSTVTDTISVDGNGYWSYAYNLRHFETGNVTFTFTGTGDDGLTNSYNVTAWSIDPIASLEDGGYVVTYSSELDDRDQDGFGTYAQRYNSDGSVYGKAVLVNTSTEGNQVNSDVTGLDDGGYVVVWQSEVHDGTQTQNEVYAQRFDANNNKVGSETLINTTTDGMQANPEITSLSNGGYVVIWQSEELDEAGSFDVYVQVFDENGERVSSEVMANTTTQGSQTSPQVSSFDDGSFVVIWESLNDESGTYEVTTQRFDANGAKVGNETQITKDNMSNNSAPFIATMSDGGYVISWVNTNANTRDIVTQTFDASGQVISGEIIIDSLIGNVGAPEVAALNDGYVITYLEDGNVKVKVYDDSSNEIKEIELDGEENRTEPHITELKDGGFLVTWSDVTQSGNRTVLGQRFDKDAQKVGEEFSVGKVTQTDDSVLTLDSEYANIDFDSLAASANSEISKIDATQGKYILEDVRLEDVITLTDESNDLIFVGDNGDEIDLANNDEWVKSEESEEIEGEDDKFFVYTNTKDPTAKLFIDEDIDVI